MIKPAPSHHPPGSVVRGALCRHPRTNMVLQASLFERHAVQFSKKPHELV